MKHPDLVKALDPILSRVRTDICWKKTPDGPRRIDSPLTAAKLDKHVNGGPAYGAAPILPGQDTTMVAVLDLDSHKGETPWPDMLAVASELMSELEAHGMSPLAFRSSGGHGIHIYLLWEAPQDAYSVRTMLQSALQVRGLKPGDGGVARREVEIFPKQNSVAEGKYGNMFILPLAGASVPLCPLTMADLPKEDAAAMEWPISPAVPVVVREVAERPEVGAGDANIERMRSALAAIPNDGEGLAYDDWRNIMFAIHHGSGGSPDGLALLHEFSARSSKYVASFVDERAWPYASDDNGAEHGAITVGTLWRVAREHGWQEPIADEFEALPALVDAAGAEVEALPSFRRNKAGEILATIDNLHMALGRPDVCGGRIQFDTFRDEIMVSADGGGNWRAFEDADYTRMRQALEVGGFKPIGKEMMRDVVLLVASENRFDTAQLWLGRQLWDGKPRVEQFLSTYFGVDDSPYVRGVSLYLWSALAGRVLQPGVKADMVPILVGEQGLLKSSAVAAMAPAPEFFVEIDFNEKDDNLARKMRGTLVGEIGELRGLNSKDLESIKAFITRTHEKWVPKFREFTTTFPRRLVFVGTTNKDEFLADETGNRRWLPVRVTHADRAAVQRDAAQLWAEGRALFERNGVMWQVERLAGEAHNEYTIRDAWESIVETWLEQEEGKESFIEAGLLSEPIIRGVDVLRGAIHLEAKQIGKREEMRMGKVLQALGFEKVTLRVEGVVTRGWRKK